jgi:hypothetical protein
MVMLQKLASSSTAAILSAMETRLWRLQHGEVSDDISDYDEEGSVDFDDMNTSDYSVESKNNSFDSEEDNLIHLIAEAKTCLQCEQDAKVAALIQKIYELARSTK